MEWVKIEDELPELNVECLFIDTQLTMGNTNNQYIDRLEDFGGTVECALNYTHNYTHWMPLPKAPQK